MSHPDEGVLQELLDGELPEADAAAVRAHLAGCVPCAVVLRDLAAVQAESDAIVARLPLDPPLVRASARTRPRRALNLRAIGLAASVLLVAGTSWVLLRSTQQKFAASEDSAAGLALPMPSEERQEVPATTPGMAPPTAVPAAPSSPAKVRADANTDYNAKAKQDSREADAPVEQPVAKDLASQATPDPRQEAEKKEVADEAARANGGRLAEAPAPAVRMAPPPAAARLAAGAAARPSEGTTTTIAGAEKQLGFKLYTISELTPVSVEVLSQASRPADAVRLRYVVGGVPVALLQYNLGFNVHDWVKPTIVPADSARGGLASVRWVSQGYQLQLEGALPADSLAALMKRVK